jgi:hypothetical protein
MSPDALIEHLRTLEEGSADIDELIALLFGWTKTQDDEQISWRSGDGMVTRRLFRYTTNLNDALTLATLAAPGDEAGFSWEPGTASSTIARDPAHMAATPPLALCMAASARYQREHTERRG